MRRSQGRYFSEDEIKRIKQLLSSTDMTLQEIATRMGCAKSSIANINHELQIREYRGRRSQWEISAGSNTHQMETAALRAAANLTTGQPPPQ